MAGRALSGRVPASGDNTGEAPLRALILDYGNVLTFPQAPDVVQMMAARLDVAVDAFTAAYWEHRRGYDVGDYAADDYWQRVLASLGRGSATTGGSGLADWLTARDADAWMRYREKVWEMTLHVRERRVTTAMLSNMSRELAASIRLDRPLERWFDAVVVSGEVHRAKPDPRIYTACLERLGVEPEQALFVDDRPENVRAATALGIRTVHFQGDGQLETLRAAVGDGS